jgi:hypothetical protein
VLLGDAFFVPRQPRRSTFLQFGFCDFLTFCALSDRSELPVVKAQLIPMPPHQGDSERRMPLRDVYLMMRIKGSSTKSQNRANYRLNIYFADSANSRTLVTSDEVHGEETPWRQRASATLPSVTRTRFAQSRHECCEGS